MHPPTIFFFFFEFSQSGNSQLMVSYYVTISIESKGASGVYAPCCRFFFV